MEPINFTWLCVWCSVFFYQHLHPNQPKDLSGLQSSTLFCQWQCNFLEIESEIVSVVLLKGCWKTFLRLSKALKSKSWHFEWHFRGKTGTAPWVDIFCSAPLTSADCVCLASESPRLPPALLHQPTGILFTIILHFFLHGCATIWLGIGHWTKDSKQKDTKVVNEREIESCKVLLKKK